MARSQSAAIWVVLVCAALWGFWWFPVALFEGAGLTGPWIGLAMSVCVLPVALVWAATTRGSLSGRAVVGAAMAGLAVTLYAISASYTDFIRAVLLFYLAPAWSTIIEVLFFGRRWTLQSLIAIAFSLIGVILISRGEISFEGLGAIGDWMALGSGISWSIGTALMFAASRADPSRVLVVTALGGALSALVIGLIDGSVVQGLPVLTSVKAFWIATGFAALYVGVILAGTMWGAFRLPPAVMTYLLSLEVLGGVLSSAFILGERFGWFEAGGAFLIISAVLIEVLWTPRTAKAGGA